MEESIKSCEGILIGGETAMVIGEGTIVIRINQRCGKDEVEEVEKELAEKFGRKVILLDTRFGEILTLPPEKHPGGAPRRP
ncbi:hypothetical protein [uncultured Acetatifactor sp.]|jgi:hypothetical protein|uniref:hypothetical protein n=1 Tax=uncultured Acetatifactor sp. TaxID=1671927 RepID=UPI0026128A3B|nr:hypothetical protein [uncultured Acetatifactor sp.]